MQKSEKFYTVNIHVHITQGAHLNAFRQRIEHLAAHLNGAQKVLLSALVDHLLARVVPIEVHDRLLQPQQIVHGAVDQVDAGGVAGLRAKVVLEI